jgi:hypothetical protein
MTVDAQTGEILRYYYYDSYDDVSDNYNMTKADALANKIAKSLAPTHIKEYTDYSSRQNSYTQKGVNGKDTVVTNSSSHSFGRTANGIAVSGNEINITLNSDMTLTYYSIDYENVTFADPAGMLTAEQVLDKFSKSNDLNLYYVAKTGKKKTATVLVYGADSSVYCDAFTGEQLYTYTKSQNDLSGITNASLKKKAETLADNGLVISSEKFSENDAVKRTDFNRFLSIISSSSRYYTSEDFSDDNAQSETVTRGEAAVLYTKTVCGDKAAKLEGIFRSPFSDVKEDDENIASYAIAYALGAFKGTKLNAAENYTYADFIELIYNELT